MTGAACGAENAYPSGAPDFSSGFLRGLCCLVICVSLFLPPPPCCHLFVAGGLCTSMTRIAMLAGVLILLLGPPKANRLKDRGRTKQQHSFSFSYFPIFLPLSFLLFHCLFLFFPCFTRPYITFCVAWT